MSSIQRLQSLEYRKKQFESEIALLTQVKTNFHQQIKAESRVDKQNQLRKKIEIYSIEINELYDYLDNIEKKINQLKSHSLGLSKVNPKNQQELNFYKTLSYIDFKTALKTFEIIQSQFNQHGDVALFFIQESLIKRGDLFLQRLRDNLTNINSSYGQNFRYCPVTYTSANLEGIVQEIAKFFGIKNLEPIELVTQIIGNSLQNNSVLFIEINCDINDESEIEPLIPWFIEKFWQPLKLEVNKVTKNYEGIKVIAVIISNLKLDQIFSTKKLSPYLNKDCNYFKRDKFVKIPLENWTENDIKEWLFDYSHPSVTDEFIKKKAYRIFNESSNGVPRLVSDALEQQWQTLISPTTSD